MINFHFDTSLYRNLREDTKEKLHTALVKFAKETIDRANLPENHTWLVSYGVFPLVDRETKDIKTYFGVKIFVDLIKFKKEESFNAITILEVDEHDSEVPDELLDFYNEGKEFNAQIIDLDS